MGQAGSEGVAGEKLGEYLPGGDVGEGGESAHGLEPEGLGLAGVGSDVDERTVGPGAVDKAKGLDRMDASLLWSAVVLDEGDKRVKGGFPDVGDEDGGVTRKGSLGASLVPVVVADDRDKVRGGGGIPQ